MAYITVNETGTFPALILSTDIANLANTFLSTGNLPADANAGALLNVTCLQDVTVTNSTGIFSWTDFCSKSINKVTTPSDNEISTNIVIQDEDFFGDSAANTSSALYQGVSGLSQNRIEVAFRLQMNNSANIDANTPANTFFYCGRGYLSSVAPTASPDSPVWVSPLTIAVNGDMGSGPKV